jgi:hypothetical protein
MLHPAGETPSGHPCGWQTDPVPAPDYGGSFSRDGALPGALLPEGGKLPRSRKRARVAIVLDDAGGRNPYQWLFLDLRYRLTFAVLPDLEDSRCFAERARKQGFELILHAPMEPHELGTMRAPERMISSGWTAGRWSRCCVVSSLRFLCGRA